MAQRWAPLETHVRTIMDTYGTPGLALALARSGEVLLSTGFGYRDLERGLPVTPHTLFPVASVTKSFTALAVMQLQDAGRLGVSDPIVKYLPEFRTPDRGPVSGITVHHLLTHTAGIPPLLSRWFAFARDVARDLDAASIPVQLSSRPPIDTYEQLMEFMATTPWKLLGPPGSVMSYSNEGYALLGAIIERVSGLPYNTYLRTHILVPLELHDTRFDNEVSGGNAEAAGSYFAKMLPGGAKTGCLPRWHSSYVWSASGGICSTVQDLLRYLDLYCPRSRKADGVISPGALAQMMQPHVRWSPRNSYGYGFEITLDYHGYTLLSHAGGRIGASSHVLVLPGPGITAAVLANMEQTPGWMATHAALHLMLDLPIDWRPRPYLYPYQYPHHAVPDRPLRAYAGLYAAAGHEPMRVTAAGEVLAIEIDGAVHRASFIGDDAFSIWQGDEEVYIRFLVNQKGRVWGVSRGLIVFVRARPARARILRAGRALVRRVRDRARLRVPRSGRSDEGISRLASADLLGNVPRGSQREGDHG